jgi:transcriptional regulator with XRE-family HTH domain
MPEKSITREQCAAARAMLGWSMSDLAHKAKCSESTVRNFEAPRQTNGQLYIPAPETMASIVQVFEKAGLEFTPENGHGPGVRLGLLAHYRMQREDYRAQLAAIKRGFRLWSKSVRGGRDETPSRLEHIKKQIERLDGAISRLERGERTKFR